MAKLSLKFRLISVLSLICAALVCTLAFGGRAGEAADEFVTIYAADCATPQTYFNLGDTVCVQVGNFPAPLTTRFRRVQWSAPDKAIARLSSLRADPQFTSFVIPSTGTLAQPGTWQVTTIDASGEGFAAARFIVRNPAILLADLWVTKLAPDYVLPGDKTLLTLQVGNPGPDYAEVVEFVSEVPSNMIFSALRQVSGPPFDCSTPENGEIGRTICRTKYMKEGDKAEFHFYYQVNPDAREGTVCSGGTSVSSYYTEERGKDDNFWTTEVLVGSLEQGDCTDCAPVEP